VPAWSGTLSTGCRRCDVSRAAGTTALGVVLCLAAATFDVPSLYVPGVTLTALGLGAAAWVWLAARGAGIERGAGPSTVVEEEPYPLRLRVRAGLLPPPGGALLEPLLGWPVPIAGRWSRRVRINVRFSRRGRRKLDPAILLIRDPLGLAWRELAGPAGGELLVLPRVEPLRAAGGGASGRGVHPAGERGLGARRLDGSAAELDIDGLRPYREGAPASRIHWPTVARTGEMLERRLVADLDSAPLVVLDPSNPASEDALDSAVRAAASLCLSLARAGGCAILLPGDRRAVEVASDLGAWPHVHARLAVVEAGPPPAGLSRAPRAGALLWVTAAPARRLPRVVERALAGGRYLVTPNPLSGYPASFSVAGCVGQFLERPPARRGVAA
jgi:uncharacterized protein (DUF58 family)